MGDIVNQERCPKCAEEGKDTNGDNLCVYSDGGSYCHACGFTSSNDSSSTSHGQSTPRNSNGLLGSLGNHANSKRGISSSTCGALGYYPVRYKGMSVWSANFYDNGELVGQKLRLPDKDFRVIGDISRRLWGMQACSGSKCLVITEGEVDALSYKEVFPTWDVVSIPNGCNSALKSIQSNLEFCCKFEEVILAFDNDDAGRAAVDEVVGLFPVGKVKISALNPRYKDFNDALMANDFQAIKDARYGATPWKPDGILSIEQLKEAIETPTVMGVDYPWPTLTKHTYGLRTKELIVFGAGTGMGKTEFFKQMELQLLSAGETVGCIHLEESPKDTALGVMNKQAGRTFHIPEAGTWTEEERDEAFEATIGTGRLHIYDAFGALSFEAVVSKIRYMVKSGGCKYIFLDHLTALTDGETDDRAVNQRMRNIVSDLASLTREMDFCLIAISHLRKSSSTPHEEGGRVHLDDLYGASTLKQWASFVFGLERNQQEEDEEERHTTTLRVLKDRYTGRALGRTIRIKFDPETTRLHEEEEGMF